MISADTAERLAKILPRLASEHDGEVVAAARAISRTLSAAGLIWHELSSAVELAGAVSAATSEFADGASREWSDLTPTSARAAPLGPDAPDAPSRRWGLPIWGVKKIEPWSVVLTHCLALDWEIPKAFGGRFLTKDERERMRKWAKSYHRFTNADAAWIECVVVHLHAARDQWRSRKYAKPAAAA